MDFSLTGEQHVIAETFDRFCDKELSYDYVRWMDENVDFPPDELWTKLAGLGLFAATVPAEYGGQGLGQMDSMIAYEQICKRSMSVALAVGATTGFGTRFLAELGTAEQKQRYLPRLAEGRLRTAMALTEPAGGTDILGALSTSAEDAGDSWVINGTKMFITGAHAADLIFTVCRTERDARRSESWSTIMLPRQTEGVTMRRVGAIAAIYEYCMRYVRERHAFGGPIGRFQSLQHYLADMCINLENARNLTYKAAWLCDTGQPFHLEAAMAKLVAAEGARHAGTYGTEIFGGYGICNEYPVSMFARDAYQIQFSPISNEMSRNMLMQFQGLPKSWA